MAILQTQLLTGVRSSELLALTIGSIEGLPGERRIKAAAGKRGKARTVPVEQPLYDPLGSG